MRSVEFARKMDNWVSRFIDQTRMFSDRFKALSTQEEEVVPKSRAEIVEYVKSCNKLTNVVVRPPWMCVEIEVVYNTEGASVNGAGFSKQCRYANQADAWNPEIGYEIAFGRAIGDATQQLVDIGEGQ